jgi:hypothetical protein
LAFAVSDEGRIPHPGVKTSYGHVDSHAPVPEQPVLLELINVTTGEPGPLGQQTP